MFLSQAANPPDISANVRFAPIADTGASSHPALLTRSREVRAYVASTGSMFLLLVLAHLSRLLVEGAEPLRQPVFVATTIISAVLVVWAVVIWHRLPTAS
jgi:hypothetical protein